MESRLRTRHSSQEDREVYVELAEHELEEEEELFSGIMWRSMALLQQLLKCGS